MVSDSDTDVDSAVVESTEVVVGIEAIDVEELLVDAAVVVLTLAGFLVETISSPNKSKARAPSAAAPKILRNLLLRGLSMPNCHYLQSIVQ